MNPKTLWRRVRRGGLVTRLGVALVAPIAYLCTPLFLIAVAAAGRPDPPPRLRRPR